MRKEFLTSRDYGIKIDIVVSETTRPTTDSNKIINTPVSNKTKSF